MSLSIANLPQRVSSQPRRPKRFQILLLSGAFLQCFGLILWDCWRRVHSQLCASMFCVVSLTVHEFEKNLKLCSIIEVHKSSASAKLPSQERKGTYQSSLEVRRMSQVFPGRYEEHIYTDHWSGSLRSAAISEQSAIVRIKRNDLVNSNHAPSRE